MCTSRGCVTICFVFVFLFVACSSQRGRGPKGPPPEYEHSGLRKNVAKVVETGKVERGQHQLFFLNGCNTFSYVTSEFFDARTKVNGVPGTKFLDIIANAMPAYGTYDVPTALAALNALLEYKENRRDYNDILASFPKVHKRAIMGEEDNEFPACH